MAEIALLVIFVLLLVLGTLLGIQARELAALKKAVVEYKSIADVQQEVVRLRKLKVELEAARPESTERRTLPELFRELLLLRAVATDAGIANTPEALRRALVEAAAARKGHKAIARKVVTVKKKNARLLRTNANLKAQMANLQRQGRAGGRGLDHPPCWATSDGKAEYIFDVALTSRGLIIRDRELPHRVADRAALPIANLVFNTELNPERFLAVTAPLFHWSMQHECRFVVRTFDTTGPAEKLAYKRQMRVVEQRFYKYEELNAPF